MSDLSLENVYFGCSECPQKEEGVVNMVRHIIENHPAYTPAEAEEYATKWAEEVLQVQETEDIWRAEEYRRTGQDPLDDRWDDPS